MVRDVNFDVSFELKTCLKRFVEVKLSLSYNSNATITNIDSNDNSSVRSHIFKLKVQKSGNTREFSCHNNSHQSKNIVNCVVNILSSLGDGSSEVVDANIELNSTNMHFRSLIVFIFYDSLNLLAPVPIFIRLCEYLLRETREL